MSHQAARRRFDSQASLAVSTQAGPKPTTLRSKHSNNAPKGGGKRNGRGRETCKRELQDTYRRRVEKCARLVAVHSETPCEAKRALPGEAVVHFTCNPEASWTTDIFNAPAKDNHARDCGRERSAKDAYTSRTTRIQNTVKTHTEKNVSWTLR